MVTYEQFMKEALEFRKIMTDGRNSIDKMDHAFGCLFTITSNTDPKDPKSNQISSTWEALAAEWLRRKELMIMAGRETSFYVRGS